MTLATKLHDASKVSNFVPKVDLQRQFGASVRAWRRRLGISQEELAGRAGLHRTYVCDIERGARNVSLKSVEKLAKALDVSVARLFIDRSENDNKTSSPLLSADELVNILLVEHEPADIEQTMQELQSVNISNGVHVVRNGTEALDFLFRSGSYSQRPPGFGPHIVLLALNLPQVSGLDVLRRMKADARTRSLLVVVLASSKSDQDAVLSKRLGADACIVKPVDFRNLIEVAPQLSLQWALLKPAPAVALDLAAPDPA